VNISRVDIEGAKAAYYGFLTVGDRAVADPTQDWREEFAKYAVDPALSAALSDVDDMASSGIRAVGHSSFSAATTTVSLRQVELRVCNDVSGVDYQSISSGSSVKSGPDRLLQDVVVSRGKESRWFVSRVIPHFEAKC
jgi:hypothetical protein